MVVFTRQERLDLDGVNLHCNMIWSMFYAIVVGLDDELHWPGVDHTAELANVYPGIIHGCIGVGDVNEFQVVNPIKER
jgi:hypothetical protein